MCVFELLCSVNMCDLGSGSGRMTHLPLEVRADIYHDGIPFHISASSRPRGEFRVKEW